MSSVCTRTSAKILDQQSDLPECTEDSILSCFVLCSPTLAVLALEIIGYSLSSGPEPFMIVPNCSVLIYVCMATYAYAMFVPVPDPGEEMIMGRRLRNSILRAKAISVFSAS